MLQLHSHEKSTDFPGSLDSVCRFHSTGNYLAVLGDCFAILKQMPECSVHGVVTDPPYGVKEYEIDQVEKRKNKAGGVWRIPPSFDGHTRSPLPRFTALNECERKKVYDFFVEWSRLIHRVLCPGGHVFVAANAFISQLVFQAIVEGGLEYRGEVIRLVRTLRGGDRPKNAEEEFSGVCSMPRGCYEPWGLFRKALPPKMKVSDCLRTFGTGGLRRTQNDLPFSDVISSEKTPAQERKIANHPSLKPQSLLRQLVWSVLPLGEGILLDPFMGSGSTLAAADSLQLSAIGIERYEEYFEMSRNAIPALAKLPANKDSSQRTLFH